jgi:hypothetical protein
MAATRRRHVMHMLAAPDSYVSRKWRCSKLLQWCGGQLSKQGKGGGHSVDSALTGSMAWVRRHREERRLQGPCDVASASDVNTQGTSFVIPRIRSQYVGCRRQVRNGPPSSIISGRTGTRHIASREGSRPECTRCEF